jgi:predicted secreted acid phosphatase
MRASELTNNGKLVIFDIDDTLVNTDTQVGVVRDGQIIKKLNSHDFTHYKLQPGETFDFGEFQDAREFFTKARPIPGMIEQLKNDIATGNRVIMLTARSDFNDRDIFLDTFRRFGIDMSKVHVYRAGNLAIKAATEEKKKIILRHLLGKEHFDKLIMYDDSVPNLNAFLSLKQEYPWSRFYAWHVDPNGQASEYHRT